MNLIVNCYQVICSPESEMQ